MDHAKFKRDCIEVNRRNQASIELFKVIRDKLLALIPCRLTYWPPTQ